MNDPTYVEASRKLAERILTEGGLTTEERIAFVFRLATARRPRAAEAAVLTKVFEDQLVAYQKEPKAAEKLLHVGESSRNDKLHAAEVAAWSVVASVVLNLDETITRN
jgi:hypothetical protein